MYLKTYMKFNFVILCIYKLCGIAQATLNLEIIDNINGYPKKVKSTLIEEPAGSNITLFCKILNLKYSATINAKINWFKIPKCENTITQYEIPNNKVYLEINHLSSQNEGHYACVSSKFGIFKDIYIQMANNTPNRRLIERPIFSLLRLKRLRLNVHHNEDRESILKKTQKSLDDHFKNVTYYTYYTRGYDKLNHYNYFNISPDKTGIDYEDIYHELLGLGLFFLMISIPALIFAYCYFCRPFVCFQKCLPTSIECYNGNDVYNTSTNNGFSIYTSYEEVSSTGHGTINNEYNSSSDLPPSYFDCIDNNGIGHINDFSLLPSYEQTLSMVSLKM